MKYLASTHIYVIQEIDLQHFVLLVLICATLVFRFVEGAKRVEKEAHEMLGQKKSSKMIYSQPKTFLYFAAPLLWQQFLKISAAVL